MTVVERKLNLGCVRGVRIQGWWDESFWEIVWGLVVLLRREEVLLLGAVKYNVLQSRKLLTARSLRTDCREKSGV